jgi:hypothetical protein
MKELNICCVMVGVRLEFVRDPAVLYLVTFHCLSAFGRIDNVQT